MMERAKGYYWVLYDCSHSSPFADQWGVELTIANWVGNEWVIFGWEDGCLDSQIKVVSGPLIPPPRQEVEAIWPNL